jgi:hypothetical protein
MRSLAALFFGAAVLQGGFLGGLSVAVYILLFGALVEDVLVLLKLRKSFK